MIGNFADEIIVAELISKNQSVAPFILLRCPLVAWMSYGAWIKHGLRQKKKNFNLANILLVLLRKNKYKFQNKVLLFEKLY